MRRFKCNMCGSPTINRREVLSGGLGSPPSVILRPVQCSNDKCRYSDPRRSALVLGWFAEVLNEG